MSGHTPIRLSLTRSPLYETDAISALLTALRTDFHADIREKRRDASERLLHAWGKLVIGDQEISFEADFFREAARQVSPVILLHSEAYEAAYDVLRGVVRPRGRQALIEFCLAIAVSIKAEGFSLEFASDEKLTTLRVEDLVARLISREPNTLVAGVAVSAPLVARVKAAWPLAPERNGYVTLEFI